MSRLSSAAACAAAFAVLRLATDLYHALAYGVAGHWISIAAGVAIVCAAGTLGYLAGSVLVGRSFGTRTVVYIAVLGYFVAYSLTRLLESWLVSPWIFVSGIFLVTVLVTVKIGPRWG